MMMIWGSYRGRGTQVTPSLLLLMYDTMGPTRGQTIWYCRSPSLRVLYLSTASGSDGNGDDDIEERG
jgi:hypothetical protein